MYPLPPPLVGTGAKRVQHCKCTWFVGAALEQAHQFQSQVKLDLRIYPLPPCASTRPGQESCGQTASWCSDKPVLARDARYQKNTCPENLPIPRRQHNSYNRALEHNV